MRRAYLNIVLLNCAAACAGEPQESGRTSLDAEYRTSLESLAAKCEELNMAPQARLTRSWWLDRDPGRQYLFVAKVDRDARSAAGEAAGGELIQKWHAKWMELRRVQAGRLFEFARQRLEQGAATTAYQLLHEVLREDPGHVEARRILGIDEDDARRPRSRVARLPHPQFGWPRNRWWQIESPHFQIATDHSAEAALELARRLEDFHSVWQQVCFDYWSSASALRESLAGTPVKPMSLRRHQVVLFRNRDEYVERLAAAEPQIGVTLAYYRKANQTSYFYAGEQSPYSVWYHEAAHQLFQETGRPVQDVGENWNFWAVEGVAVYFESLRDLGSCLTLGGFDSDRLQFVRSRVLGGEPQMPLAELMQQGREDLQRHPDIRRLYSQAAGLAHFCFDFDHGKHRAAFVKFLATVYAGQDSPDSLRTMLALAPADFDRDWKEFLTVRKADLRYLGPPEQRRNLSLLRADIDDESLSLLAGERWLEWFDLSFTSITTGGLKHLAGLRGLKRLSLVGVHIGDDSAAALAELRGLEELDLSGTDVTDAALPHIAKLTGLKVLRLSHTAITDAGIARLAGLNRLEELDVEQTAVTQPALASLKQRLPALKQ